MAEGRLFQRHFRYMTRLVERNDLMRLEGSVVGSDCKLFLSFSVVRPYGREAITFKNTEEMEAFKDCLSDAIYHRSRS